MGRVLAFFSCGAASAVATKLTPEAEPVYCATGSEHPDNQRFLHDCEVWFGRNVTIIKNERYADTWAVWEKRRYLSGIHGAPCSAELKMEARRAYQRPDDVHVLGYTADAADVARADRLRVNFPEENIRTPLIERGITKEGCLAMLERAGVAPPITYAMGFPHANCIPCVKAQSADYWALVRQRFPAEFERMAKLSRELDVRLVKLGGGERERIFIDEVPLDQPTTKPIVPSCDFLCQIAEGD